MKWLVVVVVLMPMALACVVPENGMIVDRSVTFCADVFYLDDGIKVRADNINVTCDGSVFKSWSGGKGISIEHAENVTISGCRVVSYDIGLYVRNASRVFLEDNHLVRNQVGTRLVVVSESATFNHDVSLKAPFEVLESADNALSLTNKEVEGSFCLDNLCNRQRNALEMFLKPQTPASKMQSWLGEQLGKKSPARLLSWVLMGLTQG